MSVDEIDQQELLPENRSLLEAQLLRKATAEADLAEAQARRQQALNRQLLKGVGDGPPSPGVIPNQETDPPADNGSDEAAPAEGTAAADTSAYKTQAKPREGSVAVDAKAGYMATIVAYKALLGQADAIADAINALKLSNAKIMMVNSPEFAAGDVTLRQVSAQLEAWQGELGRLNKLVGNLARAKADDERLIAPAFVAAALPVVAGAIAAGASPATLLPLLAGAIGATADLIGYFKTDYALAGRDVSVSDTAVRARVAGKIRGVPVYMQDFYRVERAPIMDTFNATIGLRAALAQNLDLLKSQVISPLELQIAALTADIEQLQAQLKKLKLPAEKDEKERLEAAIAAATKALTTAVNQKRPLDLLYARGAGAITAWDGVNKELTAVPAGAQQSLLTQAALRDIISVMEITHLLYVTVSSAGGEIITGKNWFLGAPQVGFLGGGAVTYLLADMSGAICAADTLAGTDYLKVKLGQDVLE